MTMRIAEVARCQSLADRAAASPAERADLAAAICERIVVRGDESASVHLPCDPVTLGSRRGSDP
jgi:hypothetical protein